MYLLSVQWVYTLSWFGFFKVFPTDACIECRGAPSCVIGCHYIAVSGSRGGLEMFLFVLNGR